MGNLKVGWCNEGTEDCVLAWYSWESACAWCEAAHFPSTGVVVSPYPAGGLLFQAG